MRSRITEKSAAVKNASTRRGDGTHRVVITGAGAVSPAGVGVPALWEAVTQARVRIAPSSPPTRPSRRRD